MTREGASEWHSLRLEATLQTRSIESVKPKRVGFVVIHSNRRVVNVSVSTVARPGNAVPALSRSLSLSLSLVLCRF